MRVAETGLTMAEYFRDVEHRMYCFSLIIFSVLYRQAVRYQHFRPYAFCSRLSANTG